MSAYPLPLLQLRASFSLTDQSHEYMGNMMMIPGSHRSPFPLPQDKRREVKVTPIQHNILCKAGYHAALPQRRLALAHAQ